MKTAKINEPLTASRFEGEYVCGENVWRNMELVKRGTLCSGSYWRAEDGKVYEYARQKRNTVTLNIVPAWKL